MRAGEHPPRTMRPHRARHDADPGVLLRLKPDVLGAGAAGRLRHVRAPRLLARHRIQRRPHRRHHPGHRGVPNEPGHHRSAVHRLRHPRAQRARPRPRRSRCSTATGVRVLVDEFDDYVPTPALSPRDPHLQPRRRPMAQADGIIITPSHNPPRDGGFKYNPPHGGPADSDATALDRQPRQRTASRAATASVRVAEAGRHRDATTSAAATWTTSTNIIDIDGDQERRPAHRRRPARRRERELLERDRDDTAYRRARGTTSPW